MTNKIADVRPSPIAGQWYPSDERRLAVSVDHYMDDARLPDLPGEVVAVVAPHAGYRFSGPVAGYAFAALRGREPDEVVVISPMHYPYYEVILTTAHHYYATPLGNIPVDENALQALDGSLMKTIGVGLTRVAYDQEHSLEIELPFLQRALAKPFSLIPIMLRDQSLRVARGLGKSLAWLISESKTLVGKEVVLVASTDLSHFYSQSVADELDENMLLQVSEFNPEGVVEVEEQEKGFACGRGALASVLFAARELGADQVKVLKHATSGDETGDYDRVVGYGAAVITRSKS